MKELNFCLVSSPTLDIKRDSGSHQANFSQYHDHSTLDVIPCPLMSSEEFIELMGRTDALRSALDLKVPLFFQFGTKLDYIIGPTFMQSSGICMRIKGMILKGA